MTKIKQFIITILLASFIFLSLKSEKTEIKYHGEKYTYCGTEVTKFQDTLESPGSITIYTHYEKRVIYDHFHCDGYDKGSYSNTKN